MAATDMYIRLIDPTGKHAEVIHYHRVWNRDRFYRAQCTLHENPAKPIADQRLVSIATADEYLAARRISQ